MNPLAILVPVTASVEPARAEPPALLDHAAGEALAGGKPLTALYHTTLAGLNVFGIRSAKGGLDDAVELVSNARFVKPRVVSGAADYAFDATGRLARNTRLPLLQQRACNTCGPTSVGMVLDTLNPARTQTNIINFALNKAGTKISKLAAALRANGISANWHHSRTVEDLAKATSGLNPAIAHVRNASGGGHFIVVDGITTRLGQKVVAIRDPLDGSAYFELVDTFLNRFTGFTVFL